MGSIPTRASSLFLQLLHFNVLRGLPQAALVGAESAKIGPIWLQGWTKSGHDCVMEVLPPSWRRLASNRRGSEITYQLGISQHLSVPTADRNIEWNAPPQSGRRFRAIAAHHDLASCAVDRHWLWFTIPPHFRSS